MKNADEMFEKLGYKKDFLITYEMLVNNTQFEVCFNSFYKTYQIKEYGYDKKGEFYSKEISIDNTSPKLLQAINEKVKELGWLGDTNE